MKVQSARRGYTASTLLCLLGMAVVVETAKGDFALGDLVVNSNYGTLFQYSASENLKMTFNSAARYLTICAGAATTPNGLLVTTYRTVPQTNAGVDLFSSNGAMAATFPIIGEYPGDLKVFPDGVLAITSDKGLLEYTQNGALVRDITLPKSEILSASCIDPNDGSDWIVDADQDVIFHTAENGTLFPTLTTSFRPGGVAVAVDGSLYISGLLNGEIYHLSSSGTVMGSFQTALPGAQSLSLSADGSNLFIVGETDGQAVNGVFDYTTSGGLVSDLKLTYPQAPFYVSVLGAPIPEPCGMGFFSLVAAMGLIRRRN